MSQVGQPIILDPPVTTHPEMLRPTLPEADIRAIRRLSARVNVLPIIARADILTNERLAAVKMAIRRDLADAGIGFGIFDLDFSAQLSKAELQNLGAGPSEAHPPKINGSAETNGGSAATSPQTPSSPSLRLPYALVSADIYSHNEGLVRTPPTRDDLILLYMPSLTQTPMFSNAKLTKGKFTRSFRWGTLDILDQNHCDFRHLRTAVFHHMKVGSAQSHNIRWQAKLSSIRRCKSIQKSICMRSTSWRPLRLGIPFNGTKIHAPTTCHYPVITGRSWRST